MTHINTTTVPPIWYSAQRVIRTALSVIISILTTLAAGVLSLNAIAPQILSELAKVLPPEWIAWLVGALAFLVVIAGVVTRIMAIPKVNAFLTKLGAGSVPKSAVANGLTSPTGTVILDGK
ncbi:hypothetical protein [Glaciihabitans sp. dw_435]|uniref:hypothetical protein n=1 Tax=Glaciihabitans sp. dw_435 TaxID=2720081 RepID=UPI001BD28BF5|nr:hypothetical protein [Glaciihabitans sp. dw_435]